jgi:glycerol-3-phosphate dehydrogenase
VYDIAIIGGGINGCGIARDAAGRGLSVLLVEKDDLAGATSSSSTKLIHGGLRYLEHYEFSLVREALQEREVLLGLAPHIIWPMRFVLPHHAGLRPAWLIRLGLFLYDHIGGRRRLPASTSLKLARRPEGAPLQNQFVRAFEYSDCWVDDARLVVLNAVDAAARGAEVRVGTEMVSAARADGRWLLELRHGASGETGTAEARRLVNAAGPWVADVLTRRVRSDQEASIRLVRGSHIVVPRMFSHHKAYIFQNTDDRVVFAIPYEDEFTLIGTTDVDVGEDPEAAQIATAETEYLCAAVNAYFSEPIEPDDVVWSYAGIRPLFDDGETSAQETTRDYVLEMDGGGADAALLNIYGGKITTYRRLAEEAVAMIADGLPAAQGPWTANAVLPGGDLGAGGTAALAGELRQDCPALTPELAARLARTYGTCARRILADVTREQDLGRHFGAGLYQREVEHLIQREWAVSAEDIIWRRTKLGLRLGPAQRKDLAAWLAERAGAGQRSREATDIEGEA